MWQGTPQTFEGAAKATTVEGPEQTIARGVTAGVVSIKQLGTNGGGYFGPNSAHPYENPTPLVELRRDLVDHGHPDGDGRDARVHASAGGRLAVVIFATMLAIYLPMVAVARRVRRPAAIRPSPRMGVDQSTGSMEGKEVRVRRRPLGAVGGDDDRDVERLGQRDARFADAARRADAADRHVAEQHLRRRRRRLHQHADLRHRRRVRRRA